MVRIGDMEEDHVADGKVDSEQYAMDDAKKDVHEDEPTEEAPLKAGDNTEMTLMGSPRDAKENDISGGGEGGGDGRKGARLWFTKSRAKWWVPVAVALMLVAAVLIVSLLTFDLYKAHEPVVKAHVDNVPRVMRVWPRPNGPNNLIHFRHGSLPSEGHIWPELTSQLDTLMRGYDPELLATSPNIRQCYVSAAPEGNVCYFDIGRIAPSCTRENNFGYDQGKPCVFLRFANVTGWTPEPYTSSDELSRDESVPEVVRRNYNPNLAFIHCRGNTRVDQENMGPVDYFPEPGFRLYFFPYENQTDYMPPMVALRFKQPAVGIAIGVTCSIWARNLNHTEDAVPSPTIYFNLLIE